MTRGMSWSCGKHNEVRGPDGGPFGHSVRRFVYGALLLITCACLVGGHPISVAVPLYGSSEAE